MPAPTVEGEALPAESSSADDGDYRASKLLRDLEEHNIGFCVSSEPAETQALLVACASGNDERVRVLLQDESHIKAALAYKKRWQHLPESIALRFMFEAATGASSAPLVTFLLEFAQEHSVPPEKLIMRLSLLRALETADLALVRAYVEAMPDCVNMSFSHAGDPLVQVCAGTKYPSEAERLVLLEYLLDHGADPNKAPCQSFIRPGRHLYVAAQWSSVDVLRLLLRHGARIKGSGAVVRAAEYGRVDVLELLKEYGADLKEARGPDIWLCRDPVERQLRAEETPIEAARRTKKVEAEDWLLENGGE